MNNTVPNDAEAEAGLGVSSGARALAPPGPPLLLPAVEPPAAGRRAKALPRSVPPFAPDRARPADPHGPGRRDAGLRRLERHRPGGPPRVAGPVAPPRLTRRPAAEGAGSHADRGSTPCRPGRSHDGPAAGPGAPPRPPAAGAGAHPETPAGGRIGTMDARTRGTSVTARSA